MAWGGQHRAPAAVPFGKEIRYPLYMRLGGPRAGMEGCGKFVLHGDTIPRPSSPYRVVIHTTLVYVCVYMYTTFNCVLVLSLKTELWTTLQREVKC